MLLGAVVVDPSRHAVEIGVALESETHGAMKLLRTGVKHAGRSVDPRAAQRTHLGEELFVEHAAEARAALIRTHPDEVDVACLGLALRSEPDQKAGLEKALRYMGLTSGQPILGQPIEVVFIGSCTNGRLSDLRQAAQIMKGRKVAAGVRTLVVPGSVAVKAQAEAEGLDKIFTAAGAEWRLPGCSMCIAMNGDQIEAGQYAVSTSNRNFEGRQGKGGRTLLASPLSAAAAAVTGRVTDPRTLMTES